MVCRKVQFANAIGEGRIDAMQTIEKFLFTVAVPCGLGVVVDKLKFRFVCVNVIALIVLIPAEIQILHFTANSS